MKASSSLGSPPSSPVRWRVVHRDGATKVVCAQTAAMAAREAGWALSECVELGQLPAGAPDA